MAGVKTMLQDKMDRHQAAIDGFNGARDGCKSDLEREVASRAAELQVGGSRLRGGSWYSTACS